MKINLIRALQALSAACVLISGPVFANEAQPVHETHPHHLSLLSAGTYVDGEDETAITFGIDYEYRVSELIGLGVVAERALGELDATTVLAVADIHLWKGLAIQVGPGVEFAEGEEFLIGRLGALYEFEIGNKFTVSPQAHYDASEGKDAIVFGIAVGRAF